MSQNGNGMILEPERRERIEFIARHSEQTTDPQQIVVPKADALNISSVDMVNGWFGLVSNVLLNADRAWRNDRILQRMMRHDADVAAAMKIREYAVAHLDYKIDPEDKEDPVQLARADAIQKAISAIHLSRQMFEHLQRAFWYGCSGAAMTYREVRPIIGRSAADPKNPDPSVPAVEEIITFAPVAWAPVHPDSIVWTVDGRVAFRTNVLLSNRPGNLPESPFKDNQLIATPEGQGVVLTQEQRASTVLNIWGIEAPDFDDPTTADRFYRGQGMRSLLWYTWFNKQLAEQQRAHYMERLAKGMIIGYAPGGATSVEKMTEILEDLVKNIAVVIPTTAEATGDVRASTDLIQILEPSGTGFQIFNDTAEKFSSQIVRAILGQELTTQQGPTGLGSNLADVHQDTQNLIFKHDARTLDDSLTRDLVRPIVEANWGPDEVEKYHYRFMLPEETDQTAEIIEIAERLTRMGVEIASQELLDKGGFRNPGPDEPTVGGRQMGLFDESGRVGDLVGSLV